MDEFRIDILDSTGARVGDGPLTTVLSLEDTTKLDGIGNAQFVIPAEDERAQYISAGAQFDIYDRVDGYLGRFYYRHKRLNAKVAGGAQLAVTCHNQLIELARESVHFRRVYTAEAVEAVITDLVNEYGEAGTWTATVDASIGTTTVSYEGESILLAIDVLRDRWNKHFRLGAARVLEFGAFGEDSGIVLMNLRGQIQADIARNTNVAIVETIQLLEESDEIFNRIIPLGAGQGTGQLTIEQSSGGTYLLESDSNIDGSAFHYISDYVSQDNYGLREKVLTFPNIRPITNSDANIANAATALHLAAEAYMARHLAPRVTYAITVRGLRASVNVGDLVRLQYRGIVDNYAFIDVDETFYVMDVTRKRDAGGNRTAVLNIATIAERRTSDTDVVLDVVRDLRALKVSVPITISKDRVGPYIRRINATNTAEFTVSIGDEVLQLNYAKLRFRTSPLKSSVTTVSTDSGSTPTSSSGGSSTPTSSSGGGATVTSANGGSSTPTSSNGGGATVSSAAGGNHSHEIDIVGNGGLSGNALYTTGGGVVYWNNASDPGNVPTDAAVDHTHDVTIANHTHTVTISAHNHDVTISNHTHSVTISAHTHTVTIPSHNHTLTYGLYADTTYPQVISLLINSVDVTTEIGGTWAPTNASVEIEVDITSYLVDAVGGLRQNHRIAFSCTTAQGEIEAEVNMLLTIQAISVS